MKKAALEAAPKSYPCDLIPVLELEIADHLNYHDVPVKFFWDMVFEIGGGFVNHDYDTRLAIEFGDSGAYYSGRRQEGVEMGNEDLLDRFGLHIGGFSLRLAMNAGGGERHAYCQRGQYRKQ